MTKSNLAIVLPLIFAALLICALVLITCAYCYNPMFLIRMRRRDEESSYGSSASGREKPPPGVVIHSEIVSVTSTSSSSSSTSLSSSSSSSMPSQLGIPVRIATPDNVDPSSIVVAVAPDGPNVIEANPSHR
ncbi:hypothetical protein DFH27DRAFT_526404 [Peziza echinospora]|nr:hypothetical protein DFH27DRAFT_526404 [Peziza echinospora]